jgi:hypothetical protein
MHSELIQGTLAGRRSALQTLFGLGAGAMLAPGAIAAASAAKGRRPLDLSNDPKDNLYAFGKIFGGYDRPNVGAFNGVMYARIPGKRLIPLFGFTGTGMMQARLESPDRLALKSRESGFFYDLRSGDILEAWDNPFTGERVDVYHFYNDVVGGRMGLEIPKFALDPDPDARTLMNEGTVFPDASGRYPFILPFERYGADDVLLSWDYAHRYRNPVDPAGWPRYSTGPVITPSEHFTFRVSAGELDDRDRGVCRAIIGFTRLSEPWPFMRMGGTEYSGITLFGRMHSRSGGNGFDDVPRKVLAYLEKHAPQYLEVPAGWPDSTARLDTWKAFATDVPPEVPGFDWRRDPAASSTTPPTGLGAKVAPRRRDPGA